MGAFPVVLMWVLAITAWLLLSRTSNPGAAAQLFERGGGFMGW